ncbi:lipoate--protein ligase family protein [Alsobacter sp. SYSU M60028]|uniref:Lipoate--protein ligase family protein n=1 Tax=Alsobacter ponti TaxID=2962936 RepID=A0ABT1L9E0_9HYPH|nr:lipoate--protein ligase family protein [Alsobacter ponti]MCP8937566.1 lipoate--protein ligase family protein [Alsobacter ponti]
MKAGVAAGMTGELRVIAGDLLPARMNLSITEALCRGLQRGEAPETLRFQLFPPSAIVGRHQILVKEVNLAWAAAHGVETARRMTGGGAIVMGPGILGWELVVSSRRAAGGLDAFTASICTAVAEGLGSLGVRARFRPRNDIEVDGRKVSGTGGYVDGAALVFQGTVLVSLNVGLLAGALNLPAHKLGKRGLSALADRVTDLATVLGTPPPPARVRSALAPAMALALGLAPVEGRLSARELAEAERIHDAEIGRDAFVDGSDRAFPPGGRVVTHEAALPGGVVEIVLKLRDGADDTIDQALIAGDVFATPPRLLGDLEARLRHARLRDVADLARDHLARSQGRLAGIGAEDFVAALRDAASLAAGGAAR